MLYGILKYINYGEGSIFEFSNDYFHGSSFEKFSLFQNESKPK